MAATALSGELARRRVGAGVVAATVAGNAVEFYDFLCFSFFAVYISRAFFPGGDPFYDLLKTLALFWTGFLFRPLGGIVIGAYADRAGRRPAMLLTIALITVGTMGLALVPSYATIGVAAPVLLVICRIVQGFALGGEVGPASVYLVEAAPPDRRGFYASWQFASQGMAILAGGAVGVALSAVLTKAQLNDWGWRVPFLVCLALIPIAAFLRGDMPETLTTDGAAKAAAQPRLSQSAGYIGLGILIIIGGTVSTYVGNNMTTYAITTLKLPDTVAQSGLLIYGVSIIVFSLVGGWLADRFGRKAVILWPRVALFLAIWPLFALLSTSPSVGTLWLATIVNGGLTALSTGASLTLLPELLPKQIRATGFAVTYAIGVSVFGGSTPLVVTWLIHATGSAAAPAWYVMLTSLVTIGAVLALPETRGRSLD